VTGVVGGVVGGLTGSTPTPTPSSTPASSPSPTPSSTPSLPLTVAPVNGKCPEGYDPVLSLLGVLTACRLHQ
jgi:hypothetical protein